MKIAELLQIRKGITSIIGGGGKTSLMFALAENLAPEGRVIVTTSTKIKKPEGYTIIHDANREAVEIAFDSSEKNIIVLGEPCDGEKLKASVMDFSVMSQLADYVIVEADGSKNLPLKAHADYEPVIPGSSTSNIQSGEKDCSVIYVVGADGFNGRISEVCHRPKLYCDKLNDYYACGQLLFTPDVSVSPRVAADMVACEGYGDIFFINKVESDKYMEAAEVFAEELRAQMPQEVVVIAGSLRSNIYKIL